MSNKKKNFWWYAKTIGGFVINSAIVFLPTILSQSPEYTIAGSVAGSVGIAWQAMGIRKKYMENTLPKFMTEVLDRVPNKVTGEKGSKLPGGLAEKDK